MTTDALAPLRRSLNTMFPAGITGPLPDAAELLCRAVETMAAVEPAERIAEAAFLAGEIGRGIATGPHQVAARRHLWEVAGAIATAREAWRDAFAAGRHALARSAERQWRDLLAEGLDALEANALMVAAFMPCMAATGTADGMCPASVPKSRLSIGTPCRTTGTRTGTQTQTRTTTQRRKPKGRA
jgi:hypothetical protein